MSFEYEVIGVVGATNVVEIGTSCGINAIYFALAIAQTKAAMGK